MSSVNDSLAVPLGSRRPVMPEITIYPAAQVTVAEGSLHVGDETHYLRIELPINNLEVRIPYNQRGLRQLGRDAQKAGGVAQAAQDQEG